MSTNTVYFLLPEIVLVLIATAIYLGGAFSKARDGWTWLAMAGLLLSGVALSGQPRMPWQPRPADAAHASAVPAAGETAAAPAETVPADGNAENPSNNP